MSRSTIAIAALAGCVSLLVKTSSALPADAKLPDPRFSTVT